ncbi:MAG: hypothetical protein ACI4WU_04705 [Bacilli bacterium]
MNEDEKKLLKEELRSEFKDIIHAQDLRIERICNSVEAMQKDNKEFMDFMKNQQTKGNGYIEKFIWLIIGAFISIGASFLFKK